MVLGISKIILLLYIILPFYRNIGKQDNETMAKWGELGGCISYRGRSFKVNQIPLSYEKITSNFKLVLIDLKNCDKIFLMYLITSVNN